MLWILYAAVSIFHVLSIYLGKQDWLIYSKPLLMPILMLQIFLTTSIKTPLSKLLITGVFFGWIGDLCLMGTTQWWFLGGLISFLIGHLMYIYLYSREVSDERKTHFIMEKPYWILPFTAFWIYAVWLIGSQENEEPKFPVYIYALVIVIMSIMAINRKYVQPSKYYALVIVGSVLFIGSDFMIAVRKFVGDFEFSRVYIMSTYTLAQGLIVYGCLKNNSISGNA